MIAPTQNSDAYQSGASVSGPSPAPSVPPTRAGGGLVVRDERDMRNRKLYAQNRRAAAKAAGVCSRCWKRPVLPASVSCAICRQQVRSRFRPLPARGKIRIRCLVCRDDVMAITRLVNGARTNSCTWCGTAYEGVP